MRTDSSSRSVKFSQLRKALLERKLEDLSIKEVNRLYPIPRSWEIAQWCLSAALVGMALVIAWVAEWRWTAMIPFVLAFPPLAMRIVFWVALRTVGKPASWPDLPTR